MNRSAPKRLFRCLLLVSTLAGAAGLLASCASSTQSEQPDDAFAVRRCPTAKPIGDKSAFTRAGDTVDGIEVAKVETCGNKGVGYIRLTPTSGTRVLTLGRNAEGGLDDCTPDAENPTTCPRVNVDKFLRAVDAEMTERGIETVGIGLGACGDHKGDYDAWNLSIAIRDWGDANRAVEVLARKMTEWDVKNHSGVTVKGIACGTVLER